MSNYNNLKTTIDANIKQNGNQEITGPILNSVLNQMVNILGTGYQFAGVATLTPATDPGTPDAKVFYIANGKGTYTNFGSLEVTEDEVVVLYYDTAWHKVVTGIASQAKLSELEKEFVEDDEIPVSRNIIIDNARAHSSGILQRYDGWKSIIVKVAKDEKVTISKGSITSTKYIYLGFSPNIPQIGDSIIFIVDLNYWSAYPYEYSAINDGYFIISSNDITNVVATFENNGLAIKVKNLESKEKADVKDLTEALGGLEDSESSIIPDGTIEGLYLNESGTYSTAYNTYKIHYHIAQKEESLHITSVHQDSSIQNGGIALVDSIESIIAGGSPSRILASSSLTANNNVTIELKKDDIVIVSVSVSDQYTMGMVEKRSVYIKELQDQVDGLVSDNPCDYKGEEMSIFNNVLCIGDSMTDGVFNYSTAGTEQQMQDAKTKYSYPSQLAKITGCGVTNKGIAGLTCKGWWDSQKEVDLSGHDAAIIQLGINDGYSSLDPNPAEEIPLYLGKIVDKLKAENSKIKIYVANLIPASDYVYLQSRINPHIETFVNSREDVVFLDVTRYSHVGDSASYNNGHLTALGYSKLAEDYKGYIGWHIKNNPSLYNDVQFCNTDYEVE